MGWAFSYGRGTPVRIHTSTSDLENGQLDRRRQRQYIRGQPLRYKRAVHSNRKHLPLNLETPNPKI